MSFKNSGKIYKVGYKRYLIRYLNWDDIDRLHQFVNRLSKEDTYVMLSGEKISRNSEVQYVANSLILIEQKQRLHLVVLLKDQIVGNAEVRFLTQRKSHSGTITIAIDKSVRGQRVGTALLKQLIIEARKAGLKLLTLTTMDVNLAGRAVYERCGFVQAGLIPEALIFQGKYVGELVYYLKLD